MSLDAVLQKEAHEGEHDAKAGVDPSLKHSQLVVSTEKRIAQRTAQTASRFTAAHKKLALWAGTADATSRRRDALIHHKAEVSAQVNNLESEALADTSRSARVWDRRLSVAAALRVGAFLVLLVSEIPVNQLVFETLGVNGASTLALVLGIQAAVLAIAHYAGAHFARQRRWQGWLLLIASVTAVATIVMLGQLRGVVLIQDMLFLNGGDPSEAPGLGAGAAIGLFVAIQLLFATATALLGAAGGQALTLRPLQQRRVALKHDTKAVARAENVAIRAKSRQAEAQAHVDALAKAAAAEIEAIVAGAEERWRAYQRGALAADPGQFPLHRSLGSIGDAIARRRSARNVIDPALFTGPPPSPSAALVTTQGGVRP